MTRSALPYRQKTELFLINEEGNIVVEDHSTYLMFPGWGIDEHELEDLQASARRELLEETGLVPVGELEYLWSVARDRFPEWANNEKRKKRYEQFQGEESHIFIGRVKQWEHDKSEDDAREHAKWMSLDECLEKFIQYAAADHPNTKGYREAQMGAIRSLEKVS